MSAELLATASFSAAFAFVVSIAATRAIELLGGQKGGLIAACPTTVVPAAFGFARIAGLAMVGPAPFDADVRFFLASTFTVPGGTLVSSLFLVVWRFAPPFIPTTWSFSTALGFMCFISLSTWFLVAGMLVGISQRLANPILFGVACFCVQILAAVATTWTHVPAPRGSNPVSLKQMGLRGCLAGIAIFIAVLLSSAGGEVAAIAAAFPAIFLSLQVSLWISQGMAVQGGAVGPVMLGVSSVGLYAMLFALAAPAIGILPSMILCWLGAVSLASFPSFAWLSWRSAVSSGREGAAAPPVVSADAITVGWDTEALPDAAALAVANPGDQATAPN